MFTKLEIGQQIETTIAAISGGCIFLDLNAKSEGVLDKTELCDENGACRVHEGERIKVFFTGEKDGEMHFTTKIAGKNADSSAVENAFAHRIPVEGKVEKEIKGGFEVLIGQTRAFCPHSQMGFRERKESTEYVGTVRTFLIQEYKEGGKNIIASNKAALEDERSGEIAKLKTKINEGDIVEGTVTALHDYGAFVSLGAFTALLPVSEIARERVNDIKSYLSVEQSVKAKVIKADWENERVSLSMKALIADPWDVAAHKYREGDTIDGTISKVMDYGFFVTLEAGIDGLVHISALENVERSTNLKKVFKEGAPFSVCVKEIDAEKNAFRLFPLPPLNKTEPPPAIWKNKTLRTRIIRLPRC
ncbi:MAG: 30S ribosomal protein S1 [Treponema sp.]